SPFADPARQIIVFAFKSKTSSHSTTTGIDEPKVGSHSFQDVDLGFGIQHGMLVTVLMDQHPVIRFRRCVLFPGQKLAQEEGVVGKIVGYSILWHKIQHLIAKNSHATRLESDHLNSLFDRWGKLL